MKELSIFAICILFLATLSSVESNEVQRAECGGSFKSDSNSLSYPGVPGESLTPGETCVWTVHLETTRDFRISFSNIDVNSNNSSCANGAVRIYSLSNFAPPDRIEEYSFCSGNPPGDHFYLSGNVAVIVLHVSSSNLEPGSGFTLNWEGNLLDHLNTKHLNAYSQIDRGLISYPGVGTYDSSLVATWLISTEGSSDLELTELNIEDCANPCTCEAFIVYEINGSGNLKETTRHCTNVDSPVTIPNLPQSFILSFFTDSSVPSSEDTGFSLVYFPSDGSTNPTTSNTVTTTTTENVPTTTTPQSTTVKPSECGETLLSSEGVIEYKMNVNYDNNERCVWTVIPPYHYYYNVTVYNEEQKPQGDGVLVAFIYQDLVANDRLTNVHANESGTNSWEMRATHLIVTFYSNSDNVRSRGFRLEYRAFESYTIEAPVTHIISSSSWYPEITHFKYPENGEYYKEYASAAYIFTPDFKFDPATPKYGFLYNVSIGEATWGCLDSVMAFQFSQLTNQWEKFPVFQYCEAGEYDFYSDDMLLFMFMSHGVLTGRGFELHLSLKDLET